MSNPEHVDECYTLPPCESNYTPKGSLTKLDDGMDVYLVGDKGSSKGIVFQYDIFGMHPCSQQVADLLAAQGFRVAIPDVFTGNPWPLKKEIEWGALSQHLDSNAPFEKIKPAYEKCISLLTTEGCKNIGIVGFCWGVGVAVTAASTMPSFKAVAGAHPPKFTEETVKDLNVPLCLLPASTDVDCSPLFVKMSEKGVQGCVHQRFDDMHHGFMGARANFEDENNRKRTSEGVVLFTNFFRKALSA